MAEFLASIGKHYEGSVSEAKARAVEDFKTRKLYDRVELFFTGGGSQMIYVVGTYGQRKVNPGIIYMDKKPSPNAPQHEIDNGLRTIPSLLIERAQFLTDDR